ncbi:1,4-beta-xylanase [Xylanimonas allomyrinae]|uniref:Beta-xylanase n=1 Tax=Xylanimonas allomyrinae TaxID=2509459 RepID=A0A4P6EJD0_9MICO|nr:endo-1,4-beta-xylanase [Xylanimonas allomyrinae]QAY62435.1 1,4-beta-xylanase [Xylanimonas allomyrinae]
MSTATSHFTPPARYTVDPSLAHRRATAVVTVRGADGAPLADADVVVEQTNHEFLFGNIGFELVAHANRLAAGEPTDQYDETFAERWFDLFNQVTLPFYWGTFEPVEGAPRTQELLTAARWFAERDVVVKGHPLVWHTVQPRWLLGKPLEEVERLQRERIRRDTADFAGVVDLWDAINEVVIMPVFTAEENGITPLARAKGRVETIRMAFEEARAVNPGATLLLNDFDMSTAYECLIEAVLEAGITIDRLGLQSHQHQGYWGREKTLRILDRFSRYNIPIHMTETTLLSGEPMPKHIVDLNDWQVASWPSTPEGEQRQADEIEEWYRTLLSHPQVEAITYWGLGDRGMWLGAPGGLLREDATPKPSYDRLHALVKGEWWTPPTTLRTDAAGRVDVTGFRGEYRVSAAGSCAGFTLATDAGDAEVTLTTAR